MTDMSDRKRAEARVAARPGCAFYAGKVRDLAAKAKPSLFSSANPHSVTLTSTTAHALSRKSATPPQAYEIKGREIAAPTWSFACMTD
jgi:hypothetical protein